MKKDVNNSYKHFHHRKNENERPAGNETQKNKLTSDGHMQNAKYYCIIYFFLSIFNTNNMKCRFHVMNNHLLFIIYLQTTKNII